MSFGDFRGMAEAPAVHEFDSHRAVTSRLGDRFINIDLNLLECRLHGWIIGFGICEAFIFKIPVHDADCDDVVYGELPTQTGFDFGMKMTLVSERWDADDYLGNVGHTNVVLAF